MKQPETADPSDVKAALASSKTSLVNWMAALWLLQMLATLGLYLRK